jgi:hypothetical protein
MHDKILLHLLEKGATLYGGFVRDYLIRGENFSDIDYYFENQCPIDLGENTFKINNQIINFAANDEPHKLVIDREYHFFHRTYHHDLSCNLFGFDKDGFFPLPCRHENVDLEKFWQGILNKEFYKLSNGKLTKDKLISRGWKMIDQTEDLCHDIIHRDRVGIWQEHNEIALQRIKDIK